MMTNNNSIITFEEILKLFGQLDKPKESALFHEKFPVFMAQKSEEDRQFIGTIMLSLTSDNAIKLMRDMSKSGHTEMLEKLEQKLLSFKEKFS
jgi:hypothetical protein